MDRNMESIIKNYKVNGVSKIDMHVHYVPQAYREAILNCGEENPDGFPTPEWDPETHLKVAEQLGISTTMLSITSPHINFGDDHAAKALAREVNEDGAKLIQKYPGHFGLLASLPLPDVATSIEEIQYAIDVLHADGFTLPTNTQGVYLGNPCLDPLFEELNKRKAVVVLHPNMPSAVPEYVLENFPMPFMEFFFDTTRAVMNMILKGTLKRFPDIKIVVPHAGAVLPILADRIHTALQMLKVVGNSVDVYDALQGLYYDVAGVCLPRQLDALLSLVGTEHLLYGSDYPYTPAFGCIYLADALDKTDLLTNEQRRAIYRDNAANLFPRLK
ncbi:amidohydrolase family protein [Pelosinus fermentans]|uniref:6-methylsalicylate decarboxylase n=1 Tax=Pelosinus fermentans JBW45 TaxID=1192197 RepID=I9NJM8_9FIRM|nr:amidohydrolase family protein [Pelosinus fermentans]AJQ25597.1 amidohydrolase 2 [Pelosinus fermentans JBW45]